MKNIMKYFFMFTFGILLLPVAIIVFWIYLTFRVIKYLLGEKDKYNNIGEFLKNTKNIIASVLAVICLVVFPIGLIDFTKGYIESEKLRQEEQVLLEEQQREKEYQILREQVLDPSYRIKREIDRVESVYDTCILTEEEIKQYNITDKEIKEFEKDRELAINDYLDEKLIDEFERLAKTYVSDNTPTSIHKYYRYEKNEDYGFNDDKTTVTILGYYKGRTMQLTYVRAEYSVTFDVDTKEVIDINLGKETIDSTKHPRK